MADAEESPSSLAELEAVAGLEGESLRDTDDNATDHDVGDFDLASLAASQAVVVPTAEPDASTAALATSETSAPTTATGSADSPAVSVPSRGPRGFVSGLAAGVAVAGLVFALTNYGSSSVAPQQPDSQSHSVAIPVAKVVPVTSDPPAPASTHATAAPVVPVTEPVAAKPPATAARPVRATTAVVDDQKDPTRPPDSPAQPEVATPGRPIDSLLDDALAPSSRAKAKRAADVDLMGAELPLTPTAADVTKVIQVLLPAIRGCAMGQSGVANTLLVVRADGGVATASITGAPYAGAASGQCMEGVLRRAKFPRFRQSVFRVQFPLSIRASSP